MPAFSVKDAKKYAAFIFFASATAIVSAYAFFLLLHILIIFPADHLLTITVAIEISILISAGIVLLAGFLTGRNGALTLAGLIILLWLVPQVTFIIDIETDYGAIGEDYRIFANDSFRQGDDQTAIAWNISLKYLDSFFSSGNDVRNPIPVRSIFPENEVYRFHILLYYYLFAMDGLEKLNVSDGRGNCSEYASAVAYLTNRTMNIPTRFVIMDGYNHKFAEAMTRNGWIVLDPIRTTPESPVRAEDYAEYLCESNPAIYEQVKGVYSKDGNNLSSEHRF